jgi:serine/threonine protein kinase
MDDYEIVRTCGEGSFAVVFEARHRKDGSRVAVKKIKTPAPSWDACMHMRELRAFKTVGRHHNIVGLKNLILEKGSLYFCFEFLERDLHSLIVESRSPFDDGTVRRMARDVFSGLAHMHARGFLHRDLKPENVLCDAQGSTLKLGDLGLAREIRSRPPYTDYVATRWYRAPELCAAFGHSPNMSMRLLDPPSTGRTHGAPHTRLLCPSAVAPQLTWRSGRASLRGVCMGQVLALDNLRHAGRRVGRGGHRG